eukprot:5585476-Amphidinium_carterae.1
MCMSAVEKHNNLWKLTKSLDMRFCDRWKPWLASPYGSGNFAFKSHLAGLKRHVIACNPGCFSLWLPAEGSQCFSGCVVEFVLRRLDHV